LAKNQRYYAFGGGGVDVQRVSAVDDDVAFLPRPASS
jgi:hypothetical protein